MYEESHSMRKLCSGCRSVFFRHADASGRRVRQGRCRHQLLAEAQGSAGMQGQRRRGFGDIALLHRQRVGGRGGARGRLRAGEHDDARGGRNGIPGTIHAIGRVPKKAVQRLYRA